MAHKLKTLTLGTMIATAIVTVPVSLVTTRLMLNGATTASTVALQESVYDRVIKSGTIRCGYTEYPPFFHKDPNTGAFSGLAYEVTEKVGQSLGLKIEWSEDVPWGSIIEGLVSDRYDAFCSDLWSNPVRGKIIDFSRPIAYSALNAYVRTGETSLAQDAGSLNRPSVRMAVMDGEMGDLIAHAQFPAAQRVELPQGTDVSQLMLEVTSGKADVMFTEPSTFAAFDKSNPGQLKPLSPDHPVRVLPNTIAFRRGQQEFKAMIDHALEEMIDSGEMDVLLGKYEPFPGALYRDAQPYRAGR